MVYLRLRSKIAAATTAMITITAALVTKTISTWLLVGGSAVGGADGEDVGCVVGEAVGAGPTERAVVVSDGQYDSSPLNVARIWYMPLLFGGVHSYLNPSMSLLTVAITWEVPLGST